MGTVITKYPIAFEHWYPLAKKWEGGISDRNKKDDPGGLTNQGITWNTFVRTAEKILQIKPTAKNFYALTPAQVRQIAYLDYWVPGKVDTAFSDAAKVLLMEALWIGGGVKSLGFPSIAELNKARPSEKTLRENRLKYYKSLKNWEANKNGWTNRLNDWYDTFVENATEVIKEADKKTGGNLPIIVIILLLLAVYKIT